MDSSVHASILLLEHRLASHFGHRLRTPMYPGLQHTFMATVHFPRDPRHKYWRDLCHNLMGILTSIPDKQQATIEAVAWSARAIGIACALTISSVIFQTVSRTYLNEHLLDKSLVGQFSNTISLDSPGFAELSHSTQEIILKGSMKAINAVFYFLLAQAVLSIFVSLFIEDNIIKQGENEE